MQYAKRARTGNGKGNAVACFSFLKYLTFLLGRQPIMLKPPFPWL
jgi:hypothetical protein